MSKKNKNKVGRPAQYDWNKVNFLWKHKTDPEIAREVGCTVPNVRARRERLVKQNADFYTCKRPKWDRAGRKNTAKA